MKDHNPGIDPTDSDNQLDARVAAADAAFAKGERPEGWTEEDEENLPETNEDDGDDATGVIDQSDADLDDQADHLDDDDAEEEDDPEAYLKRKHREDESDERALKNWGS